MPVDNILKIKINTPPLGANILKRSRLLERLEEGLTSDEGFTRPFTLVSAPAGFGKTTLVRKWLAGRENLTAWFSLDEGDNEPVRFWLYLVSALQTCKSETGKAALEMLRSAALLSDPFTGGEPFLTPLLNDLLTLQGPIFLILDDYHLINNPRIHEDMVFFMENLPPTLHLVVTTRSEPPWPLARWRARSKMTEIRQKDLQFSEEEANHLFAAVNRLELSKSQVGTLHNKTEGWITGLQLAAASLAHTSNPGVFLKSFTGSHRHVFHFLSEEVFNRQPEPVQDFLLQTSILKRFCSSLCNAVTGREDSVDLIASLELENLFVIPLDEQGTWYRYHTLFSDLLYHYLKNKGGTKIAALHEKASNWFLGAGEPTEAVRHAMGAGNYEKAAWILHDYIDYLWEGEGVEQLLAWLNLLHQEFMERYPRLIAYRAIIYLLQGNTEETKWCLELADKIGYEDAGRQEEFKGMLAIVRSYRDFFNGDLPAGVKNAEEAMKLLPKSAYFWRIFAAITYGDMKTFSGDLESAYDAFLEAYRISRQGGSFFAAVSAGMNILKILWMKGELAQAHNFAEEILRMAREESLSTMPRVGPAWIFLGELLREKGELDEAERCINRGLSIGKSERLLTGVCYLFQVMLYFSRHKYEEALKILEHIENIDREAGLPELLKSLVSSWKTRILLEKGETAAARNVMVQTDCENLDTIFFHGNSQLILIRLLLAENNLSQTRQVIGSIKNLPHYGKSRRLIINTLLLEAFLEKLSGNLEAAEKCLAVALRTGKSAGFYQVFLDEGKEVASVFPQLLSKEEKDSSILDEPGMRDYVRKIYKQLAPEKFSQDEVQDDRSGGQQMVQSYEKSSLSGEKEWYAPNLVENLSPREIEILQLISRGFSNQDIAQKLFLSLGTVKWHTSNIYGKLGVRGRTQAVALARKLKLIP